MRLLGMLAAVVALTLAAPAAAAPLEAYGKLPMIETVSLSPSGHAAAIVATNGEERLLIVHDFTAKKITTRVSVGASKVRGVQWAGDDHLLIINTMTAAPLELLNARREWMRVATFDLRTMKVKPLLNDVDYGMNTIFSMPTVRTIKGEPTVFVQGMKFVNGRGVLSVFKVDIDSGVSRLVAQGSSETRDWVLGIDGAPVAQELYDSESGRWSVKIKRRNGWSEAISVAAPLDPPNLLGLNQDATALLYAIRNDAGTEEWRELRLDGAPAGAAVPTPEGRRPIYRRDEDRIIGYGVLADEEWRVSFFDPAEAKVWKTVTDARPDAQVVRISATADNSRIIVMSDTPRRGISFEAINTATGEVTAIGKAYEDLATADIADRNHVAFKASDGLQLSGYLTLPNKREAKGLPLVVLVHGGPSARDTPGFDWWSQALASRGYAVLQLNFRGSRGLGQERLTAGYGQWGRKMQSDLSDGVMRLAKAGYVDPTKVCIAGSGYGGYAALAGMTLEQGRYRCAVSLGGISDLPRQWLYWSQRGGETARAYWARLLGGSATAELKQLSPLTFADRASGPVLLIHGRDDTVVPLDQSQVMAKALEKAGKPSELVVLKGEDAWLSSGESRLQMLQAMVAFIEKHNPPN